MPNVRNLMNGCQADALEALDNLTRTWMAAGLEEEEVLVCIRHAHELLPKLWYAQAHEDA